MKFLVPVFITLMILVGCEPKDRTEGLVCNMPKEKLKPILNDIFIYEATKNSKSLDSLSLSYSKNTVYHYLYKKHKTNRIEVQEAIECFTAKEELIPILKELEASYKGWRTNPQFQTNESKDTIQQ